MDNLNPGLMGEARREVTDVLTAVSLGSGTVAVLGTPALVALMEQAAVAAVMDHLPPGKTSVGVHIDVQHLAATPVGVEVRARAELVEVDGRKLGFRIEAWDDVQRIGEATHQRVVLDEVRFLERVREARGAE